MIENQCLFNIKKEKIYKYSMNISLWKKITTPKNRKFKEKSYHVP